MAFHNTIFYAVKLLIVLVIGAVWTVCSSPTLEPTVAMAQYQPKVLKIKIQNGLLTVNISNTPLADVLIRIGAEVGFKTIFHGDLKSPISLSFIDIPLDEGIRRVAGNCSVAVIHRSFDGREDPGALQEIAEIWVFESDGGAYAETIGTSDYDPGEGSATLNADEPENPSPEDPAYLKGEDRVEFAHQALQFDEDTDVGMWGRVLVEDRDRYIRERAVSALAQIGSDSAVETMATVLSDHDVALRSHVVEILGFVGSDRAALILGQVVHSDPHANVRLTAVQVLAEQRNEVSHAFLTAATNDTDPRVKALASKALEEW